MIRPSMLSLGCGLAPRLAEQYPSTNEHAERGTALHAQVAKALTTGEEPEAMEARQAVAWARWKAKETSATHVERPIQLMHPEDGLPVTEGTPDLVIVDGGDVTVVDWKFGRPDNVPEPGENWQLIAYGLAWALAVGAKRVEVVTAFPSAEECWTKSAAWTDEEMWPLLDEVLRRASLPPVARLGDHCSGCYQRLFCPAYILPAHEGPTALAPFTSPGGITADNAERALLAVEAIEDVAKRAKDQLKAWARENGGIPGSDGRVWAGKVETVAAHQRAASTREVFKWRRRQP